ncbi:MAG: NAD(P)/FAD-dependent oxidoreductase [Thaumarchaeota archaeon]|nr:NAD(P)/FAD-dependent oxidoreductase [Nitrososphaerota archaeon]
MLDKLCHHRLNRGLNVELKTDFDVIVVGGSVSGLLAARGIAESGCTVKVLEDDLEIGLPERCDGLVSLKGLEAIGMAPTSSIVQNRIKRAVISSPKGESVDIDAERQKVLVLDRSRFDRELAGLAARSGAEIEVGQRVTAHKEADGAVLVETQQASYTSKWMINATGYTALTRNSKSTLPAAKYEVYGDWFDSETIDIYFDQKRSPGYFTWVIPMSGDTAKVGVAGWGGNQFRLLDEFVKKHRGVAYKKIAAQIVVGGPLDRFVSGRVIAVGDAAGQAKPTTGGGIYSGGLGGLLAGRCVAESVKSGDVAEIGRYEEAWRKLFGGEFKTLLRLRRILDRLDNDQIDQMFKAVASSGILEKISLESDFDHHSMAILRSLGLKNVFKIASIVASDLLEGLPRLGRTSE